MTVQNSEALVFSAGETFYESEEEEVLGGTLMSWELIFLGVLPGAFRVGYREVSSGDQIRPASSLDLTFLTNHRYFTVMEERFEISRVDNDGLEVRHLE